MKYYCYLLLVIVLLSPTIFAFAAVNWEAGEIEVKAKAGNPFHVHRLWEPSPPYEPEYNPYGIALRIQLSIEQLIESRKFSVKAAYEFLTKALTVRSSSVPLPLAHTVSLPSGVLYELGACGSKQKASPKTTKPVSAKKVSASKSTYTTGGKMFTLLSHQRDDAITHHATMQTVISQTLISLEKPIGTGVTSYVYKIQLGDKTYAVKKAKHKRNIEELKQEGGLLLTINHPNIIHLDVLAWSDTDCFLVFEYYPSDLWGHLLDNASDQPVTGSDAVRYISQLVSALDYLHQQGYSHSDLKPENIFVSSSNTLILADLGNLGGESLPPPRLHSGIYAAPETQRGQKACQASDLWELGIVIFFLLEPKKIAELINTTDGYMNALEFIGLYAKQEGINDEWGNILSVTPDRIVDVLPSENEAQWHLLRHRALLYALAVLCLRLKPETRLPISQLNSLISLYLLEHPANLTFNPLPGTAESKSE